ncbi:cell division protein SepF [uncultured Corynebacterium sp.]|uniref:cell division protein SepF n=1 Tax=uncultured Corynebacterium sp. TaxID=159447 RepID=UPI0025E44928|nr:cell division protein SepF [uncultured Corynebacterium sp.]
MSNISRKFSDFFGLTPAHADSEFDDDFGRDEYRGRDEFAADRYSDSYEDDFDREPSYRPRGYDRDEPRAGGRGLDRDRVDAYERPHLRPLDRPIEPSVVRIAPKTDFVNRFSEAKTIGEHFRDGDIVVVDLYDLDEAEQVRYVDFVSGLAFALRGTIEHFEGDDVRFTLLPEGAELSDVERDRMSV